MSGLPASKLGRYLLGDIDDATVLALAATFANADLDISALARATLDAGVGGAATPTVLAPLPWLLQAIKATGARVSTAELADPLRSMGQLPGNPPNVGAIPARRRGWRRRPLRPAARRQSMLLERRPTRLLRLRRLRPATGPGWPTCSCVRLASRTRRSPPSRISNRPCPPDPVRGRLHSRRFA